MLITQPPRWVVTQYSSFSFFITDISTIAVLVLVCLTPQLCDCGAIVGISAVKYRLGVLLVAGLG